MDTHTLTKRESEIAELLAWGASKKDVANRLLISERTVENHTRNIYEKIGVFRVNELSAWWFCNKFHISFDLSPLKRKVIATALLCLMIPHILDMKAIFVTRRNTFRTARVIMVRRKADNDNATFGLI